MSDIKPDTGINLDEVAKLVGALEVDLADVKQGKQSVQTLRDEVDALKLALDRGGPTEGVRHRLTNIHGILDNAVDVVIEDGLKVADYASRIGRMLGM